MTHLSFQKIILTLQAYWADRGCLLVQSYDMEMGAGTFHPLTLLRALGSDPWRAAYVQPCRRPQDARFGKNQNRLGHYCQFQVLLKPTPADAQELYLGSLEELSIRVSEHDIRFVEDDWESPTVGASGLGWEVWCDGMEVSQFTYFQQVCSQVCDPVCVELTYGLERLAMYVQGKESVYDIIYDEVGTTYGQVYLENERQYAPFYFEHSEVEALIAQFAQCERQCQALLEKGLVLPAYDDCIKASHLLNMLEARGVLSVVQRQEYVARVRALAKECGRRWLGVKQSC